MTDSKRWIVLALVALVGAAAVVQARRAAQSPIAAQAAAVRVPLDSGAAKFAKDHIELLSVAAKLQPPSILPPATAGSESQRQIAAPSPMSQLPPVPPEQQVTIALTSSAIGEIDPCG